MRYGKIGHPIDNMQYEV